MIPVLIKRFQLNEWVLYNLSRQLSSASLIAVP